jgi:hypothetical protein
MSDDDITELDRPEIRALRQQILDCCQGRNGAICIQALLEVLSTVIEGSARDRNHMRETFEQVIMLLATHKPTN